MAGILTYKGVDSFNLRTGDIEFMFLASMTTLSTLPEIGERCTVYSHLHHKEDQMFLIGFSKMNERNIFNDLISISGIGPKQAIKILSGITPEKLIEALEKGDVQALTKIPGLGKKSAQKIILALKDKLVILDENKEQNASYKDIELALINMGYEKKSVSKAIEQVIETFTIEEIDSSERDAFILKKAIIILS